ncbi:MAG: glycoside hydrolase 15-like protein [Candidatus Saccharibacteria bacterium]|nr:glycoside hydrolase 15-like protein [Candidatus Saccharibacteria bacterium]
MGRPVVLSNGHILVGLNDYGTVHDFYYPYVGLENLTTSRNLNHKIGVWANDKFSWLDDGSWKINMDFEEDALVSDITAESDNLKVKLHFSDFVDNHYPAFCRIINIENTSDQKADIRVFTHQAFQISRAGRSDTALYVPEGKYLLDYKGWSTLLIYSETEDGEAFDQFAVGNYGIEGKEGTFRDAEDGELSGSLVEHGGVDSVMRLRFELEHGQSAKGHYWVIASGSQIDAEAIHQALLNKGIESRLEATRQSWNDWLATAKPKLDGVDEKYRRLAKKSLLIVKAHFDKHGGVIASSDSSIYNYGRDYYCYVWPRDGAYALLPLIELGYKEEAKKFFEFCADTMHPDGYMMHKYQPDRAIGSTWHPQLHQNHPELPIQEDETAGVIYALSRYLEVSGDKDFVRDHYRNFIKPAGDFMAKFIDESTSLPHASYDLWEERFATHSYTVFITICALRKAAAIARLFNFDEDGQKWEEAADKIHGGLQLLFNPEGEYIRKSVLLKPGGDLEFDNTLDASSAYGALLYMDNALQSEELSSTIQAIEKTLLNSSPSGGIPRYENDNYFLTKKYLGNPWIITTLWLAQYYIRKNQPDKARELLDWVSDRAGTSGMLAEQVDPETGFALGVNPLVWSHSTFVETAILLADS